MTKHARILYMVLIFTILTSCSEFSQIAKSTDYDAQYKAAVAYYEDGSYGNARRLIENLQLHYRNRETAENMDWIYANSVMQQHDYYLAAYSFTSFLNKYPYSDHNEDALYRAAFCKYMESPIHSLDQSITHDAINDLERFVEKYPSSPHIPEVNAHLDELRNKLMLKDYEIAYSYYFTGSYHAANMALKNFINLYPDAPQRQVAQYYIISSGYEYAINSNDTKIKERLQQVVSDFDKYAPALADSKYFSSAQNLYTKAKANLVKLEKTNK